MADERKTSRKWSLEEIDELLRDSGMLSLEKDSEQAPQIKKAESVNPRPIHNDDIEHRIISTEIQRSDSVAEPQVYGAFVSEKYREKFFNRPVQNLEKTAEHEIVSPDNQKYERSGFVKKKSNFTQTGELSPVPKLVPDDKISENETTTDKTIVFDAKITQDTDNSENEIGSTRTIGLRSLAVTDGNAYDIELPPEDDAQLSFEGFDNDEAVTFVDEKEIEEELSKKRKEKAENFTITSEMPKEEEAQGDTSRRYGTDEYRTPDDKLKTAYYLKKNKKSSLAGAIGAYVCTAGLIAVSCFAKSLPEFEKLAFVVALLLLIAASAMNISALTDGARSFKGFKFNRNTGAFVALVAAFLQNIAFLVSASEPSKSGLSLLGAAAVLPIAFNRTAEYIEYKRILRNFDYITSHELYSVGKIEKPETAFEIGRGLLLDDPAVIASQKTMFPRRFIELSRKFYPSDEVNKKLVPIGAAAAVLISAITKLVTKDSLSAMTAFTAAMSIGVPYFSYLADCIAISKTSSKLLRKGAVLSGWEAYKECSCANAIAVDSADIFDSEGGNVYGIHRFYDIQIDEAILYTASLLVNSGGPLGNLFKRVIVGETSLLPPVESLTYEDKLGLSAWIFNRRVLVGSAELLKNHNVSIPDKALIERHLCTGRYPVYLAVDGKAAAVFIVSYDINPENEKLFKSIEKSGLSLLVRSDDANITDEEIASRLSLPQSGVKVLSAVSSDILKTYRSGVTSASDALLMHDGKAHSFLYAVKNALTLGDVKQVLSIFQICAMGVGISLVSALAFVSGLETLGCIKVILIQLFFSAFAIFSVSSGHGVSERKPKKKKLK